MVEISSKHYLREDYFQLIQSHLFNTKQYVIMLFASHQYLNHACRETSTIQHFYHHTQCCAIDDSEYK